MSDAGKFEEVATGLQFPEGPVALPDGSTLVVEIKRGTLTRIGTDGKTEVVADLGGGPNGAAIGPDDACYVANNGGFNWSQIGGMDIPMDLETRTSEPPGFAGGWIDRVDLATGDHTVLYKDFEGQRFCGPNDIVFDDAGGFWFTDFGKQRAHDIDTGALYYAKTDGSSIVQASRGLYGPNGVGLSPKGDRVYVGETFTGRLLAWDLDGPGQVKMPMATVVDATKGHFDSLAVEESGAVVVAAIGGGLCIVQPDGSGHEYLPIDDHFVTNVCFTGDDMRNAFVTLSGTGRLVSMNWARPGLPLAH